MGQRVSAGKLHFQWRLLDACAAVILVVMAIALSRGTIARNREYASSLWLAKTVVERHPSSVAHHALGVEWSRAGDHAKAIAELRAALPDAPRAHNALGVELFNQGKLSEAIDELEAFVREQPMLLEVIAARRILGRAFAQQRQWPQAIQEFRTVLMMAPRDAETHGLIAAALFGEQIYDEAIVHFRAYLDVNPNDVGALANLGIALVATNRLEEAIATFRRTIEADPHNADAERNLANALFEHREGADALG
jgi:tetratricopeptide (TPR) repeat protein